jgi:hypothetical protein
LYITMPRPKGYKDSGFNPDAVSRTGKRLPPVEPKVAELLDIIVRNRGGEKKDHIKLALMHYATEEEFKQSGL